MPFVCSETNKLGEELVGSYLYQAPRTRIPQLRPLLSGNDIHIKVKRMVYLLGRSDFELLGRDFCAAQDGTAGRGLTISTYILLMMPGISSRKRPPELIDHQRAQRNDFWLRAATRTSFLTTRVQSRLRSSRSVTIRVPLMPANIRTPSSRRSASSVHKNSALPASAVPRIGSSAGSRSKSGGTGSGSTRCEIVDRCSRYSAMSGGPRPERFSSLG